jgi:uncharacterized protein
VPGLRLLAFLRCLDCGYWLHPPGPRCPSCGAGAERLAPEAVSGRGELFSFTVNHQPWDGDPEPYVIALVELPEQTGLRLTTNLVGVPNDGEGVAIGMPVQVVFEQHERVWFPLFEPAADRADR